MPDPNPPRHRVVVLAQEQAYPFELGIPSRIFGAVGDLYEVLLCTPDGGPVSTNAGFSVQPEHGPEILATADTVIITPVDPAAVRPELSAPVRAALASVREDARVASICTGSFTLAAAGLLDGRRATTHWESTRYFQNWYPNVDLEEDVLFVHDGRIHSSAGAASGIDLCLDIIRSDHGANMANTAARRCVVAPFREGGQAQFIDRPVPETVGTSTAATREWALRNLGVQLTVADLARHAHLGVRTLERRFTEETGMAPRRWLTQQRLTRARELLETTELSIEEIAAAVGYATATSLRTHLARRIGVLPTAYRRTFSPAPAS